jgi:hypothetical protein
MAYLTAGLDKEISTATLDVYYDILQDLPCDVVMAAVKQVLAEQEISVMPTPGKIRQTALRLMQPEAPDWGVAWGMVAEAIRKYGYYRETEGLASLPEPVRTVARQIGWRELCACEEPEVVRGQFRRMYEAMQVRQQQDVRMLPEVRQLVSKIAGQIGEGSKGKVIPLPVKSQGGDVNGTG